MTENRKVAVDLPENVLRESEAVAAELRINHSGLVRLAIENFLAERRRTRLQDELAAGYIANAAIAREIAEDLAFREPDSN